MREHEQTSERADPAGGRLQGLTRGVAQGLGGRLRLSGPLARCVCIGLITLCLLFPLSLVRGVVYDRSYLYSEATDDIRSSWGRDQTVSGPLLVIPYQTWEDRKEFKPVGKQVKMPDGRFEQEMEEVTTREYFQHYRVILPAALAFDSVLRHEIRYRGIYRQALYTAPVDVKGSFTLPRAGDFPGNIHKIGWAEAWLAVGVSDLKTIAEATPAVWGDKTLEAYSPGTGAGKILGPGFHAPVPLAAAEAGERRDFAFRLTIRGSGGISFTPVGENTAISVSGAWPDPRFHSNLLPALRKVGPDGFSAAWLVSNLTRTYPQMGDLDDYAATESQYSEPSVITRFTAGVDLYENVSLYRMVRRAVEYGILFIAVPFVALFAFEMIARRRMRLLQYGMVGLSMSVFYLVLLSLAEHVSFGCSFALAGAVTVLMNSLYVAAALSSKAKGLIMAGVLAALYGVLFSILRLEDIALLAGTGVVLVMMGVLMYVTRKLPQS